MINDTIFALASASGRAGVSVVRISGPNSSNVLNTLINKKIEPRKAVFSALTHNKTKIDEGLVLFFEGPRSFTGEDCVELQLHGSPAVLESVYHALRSLGCRLAEPGEFSKRAVINGKMDLTQAEGIADLIDAESEAQRQQALTQLDGGLKDQYQKWYDQLYDILSRLEVFIDFPDEDLPTSLAQSIVQAIADLKTELELAMMRAQRGRQIRDGYRVVILGAPNAGKSSLFNALLETEAAIVTAQAGTTRDVLEARLKLGAHTVLLYDTAGLREAYEPIEQEGIKRARQIGDKADLKIWVLDSSSDADISNISSTDIVILNKIDLGSGPLKHWSDRFVNQPDMIGLSLVTNEGLDDAINLLATRVEQELQGQSFPAATRQRHFDLLFSAIEELDLALQNNMKVPELVAENVRSSIKCFDSLFGRYDVESVLDRIFSNFCIGK